MSKAIEELVREELSKALGKDVEKKEAAPKKKATPAKPKKDFIDKHVPKNTYENTKKYSEVFGIVPPSGTDWEMIVFNKEDWSEEDQVHIPEINPDYVINHEVMEALVVGVINGNLKGLVVGPTGSGKTSIQEQLCAHINQPYIRFNGRQDMESDSILGKPWVNEEGYMEYLLGELPKAAKKGYYIAFDEPWKTPSGIQMALQRFYEKNGQFQLDDMPGDLSDKIITPDPRCRVVLSDNVVGTGDGVAKYGATMIQDGSTLNRIDMVVKMDYMSEKDEVEMLMKMHPAIPKHRASHMVKVFNLIRTNYSQDEVSAAVSPRNLDAWGKMAVVYQDYKKAFEQVVLNRYAEDSERAAVSGHYNTVFGK